MVGQREREKRKGEDTRTGKRETLEEPLIERRKKAKRETDPHVPTS